MEFTPTSHLSPQDIGRVVRVRGRVWKVVSSTSTQSSYLFVRDEDVVVVRFDPLEQVVAPEDVVEVLGEVCQPTIRFFLSVELLGRALKVVSHAGFSTRNKEGPCHDLSNLSSSRFLYVRKPAIQLLLRIKQFVRRAIDDFCDEQGFVLVEPPVLSSYSIPDRQAFVVSTSRGSPAVVSDSYLTTKSQFYLEALAHSFEKVYSVAPAFRADRSESSKTLAEFYLFELEWAFGSLGEVMALLEQLLHEVASRLLEEKVDLFYRLVTYRTLSSNEGVEDLSSLTTDFWEAVEQSFSALKTHITQIQPPFPRMRYEEALQKLKAVGEVATDTHFLERRGKYLTRGSAKPLFITHFPFKLKHFFDMRSPDDFALTQTFDLLATEGFGELVSGGEREYRYHQLVSQVKEKRLRVYVDTLPWHTRLRQCGSVPHAGFSLGLDRLVAWLTHTPDISDVVPFPRRLSGTGVDY